MGAIEDARAEAARIKAGYQQGGVNANSQIDSVYKTLVAETTGLNDAINKSWTEAAAVAKQSGQSMIDEIVRKNTAAKTGVQDTLKAANIHGVGQEGMTANLGVSESIGRNMASSNDARAALLGSAQKTIGGWHIGALRSSQTDHKTRVSEQVQEMMTGVDKQLASYISNIRRQQAYAASRRRSSYSSGYRSGGYSGGSSRRYSASRQPLPSDARPVTVKMLGQMGASKKLSKRAVEHYEGLITGKRTYA